MAESKLRQRNVASSEKESKEESKEKEKPVEYFSEHFKDKPKSRSTLVEKKEPREFSDAQIILISTLVGLVIAGMFISIVGKVVTGSWTYGVYERYHVVHPMAATLGRVSLLTLLLISRITTKCFQRSLQRKN